MTESGAWRSATHAEDQCVISVDSDSEDGAAEEASRWGRSGAEHRALNIHGAKHVKEEVTSPRGARATTAAASTTPPMMLGTTNRQAGLGDLSPLLGPTMPALTDPVTYPRPQGQGSLLTGLVDRREDFNPRSPPCQPRGPQPLTGSPAARDGDPPLPSPHQYRR
ncbi:UNVERIFIED_CONTAM: hypothetical protein FKN15_038338 [Acipenser sinensis]